MSMSPPKALPVLQVGFTGHRDLSAADADLLRSRVEDVLAQIQAAAHAALAEGWPGLSPAEALSQLQLRGVCALAAGADSIAAHVVLAAGWALAAPLPFTREIYRNDFSEGAERADYDALLDRATTVHELGGIAGRTDAYRAVGRTILEQSDVLVAVWNGDPERGPGGTGEVVREARAADIPVIVIDAKPPHAVHVHAAAGADSITALVRGLLAPPRKDDADGLGTYYRETRRDAPPLASALTRIDRPLLAFRPSPPPRTAAPRPATRVTGPADAAIAAAERPLTPALEAADQLAVRYATLYRASISLRYVAVLPAVLAGLIPIYVHAGWSRPLSFGVQLLSLVTFSIGFNDRHNGWHRRFLDYRFLAEHLRYAPLMALFGSTSTLPRLPPYQAAANSDWVNWYLRFQLRRLGLVPARRDADFQDRAHALLARQIDEQIDYYAARAADATLLAARLQKATKIAYFTYAGLSIVALIVGMLKYNPKNDFAAAVRDLHGAGGFWHTTLGLLFLAGLSAGIIGNLWGAISGFRGQREYFRLSQRYDAMVRQLGQLKARLSNDDTPGQVERVAREAVEAMLAEVSDWRVLIKARDFSTY
jgi:hypothetical protein